MHCTLLQVLFLSWFKTYTKELSFFEGKINRCQNYACLFKYKILPWTTSIMMCDVLTLQFLIKHSQLNFYKSYIKTYTKYQSCIKNIFNIKRKIHGRFPSLQASHHRRVDLSLGNEWAGELRVPDPQGVLWGLDATDDHLLWAVSAGARLFGGVSRGIASAPDGVQRRHVLVHIGVGSIVLARAWSFAQILQVTTNLKINRSFVL